MRAPAAHRVLDHGQPLPAQVEILGLGASGFVLSTNHSEQHVGPIADRIALQGETSNEVAALLDAGRIRSTVSASMGTISGGHPRRARAMLRRSRAHGRIVLEGL